ncbi:MAG TPA: hypothetical protein VGG75_38610 [Trebonia sp.]|jgi:hypothetical protein
MLIHIINALITIAPFILHTIEITRLHGVQVVCQLQTAHGQIYANACNTIG